MRQSLVQKVHYLGAYPADYARHRIIQEGLRELGVEVQETRDRAWLPRRWLNLCVAMHRTPVDVPIIVGEAGNYLSPVLIEARRIKRPLLFDTFVSLRDTVEDRERGLRKVILRPSYELIDRVNCWASGGVLLDTEQMRRYFIDNLGLRPEKAHVAYVGAELSLFKPIPPPPRDGRFTEILFYGTYIPLHGIDVVLRAAAIVQQDTDRIRFRLVGDGQTKAEMVRLAESLGLRNTIMGPSHIPYHQLPELIAGSDICLGILANRPKTLRVIPNKLFQCAAVGKPVITADSPAVREGFGDDELALVPPGDPEALAQAILDLSRDEGRQMELGAAGRRRVLERFSPRAIASQVLKALDAQRG